MFSGVTVIGTAGSILSLGGIAGSFGLNTLDAGVRDIDHYFSTGMHAFPVYGDYEAINWVDADINWDQFISGWNDLELNLGYPTRTNGGAEHIMALYFQSLGIGSGPSETQPPSDLLPPDPQPGVSCD